MSQDEPLEDRSSKQWSRLVHQSSHLKIIRRGTAAGCPVLEVYGELDMATERHLALTLGVIADQCKPAPVVVDLTTVRFVSAAALSMLVTATARASSRGQAIGVAVGEGQAALIRSIRASGLDSQLPLFDTVDAALHAVA